MAQAVMQNACRKLRFAIGDEATMRLNITSDLKEVLVQLVALDAMIPVAEGLTDRDRRKSVLPLLEGAAYRVCHVVERLQEMAVPAAEKKIAKMPPHPENAAAAPNSEETLGMITEIKHFLRMSQMELDYVLHTESVQFDGAAERRPLLEAPAATARREEDVEEILIAEREEDVEKILAQLSACHSREGPIILPIHGEQGVGKATLAAMVYDNVRFESYFRIWINRSHMLGFDGIFKYIISQLVSAAGEQITGHGSDSDDEMVYITTRLHEQLNGKKVLIVLHDLQGCGYHLWKSLKDILSTGGMDSTQVIVLATVDCSFKDCEEVTSATENFGIQPYWLHPSSELCCEIIKHAAAKSADKEDLEQIAPELAKLCEGLPMVAQLIGSVLQFKPYAEWPELNDLKALLTGPLQLSYRSMPPNLRLCIAYCVFVLDTERDIVKEDLIHQWIALDLVEPSEVFSASQLAEQYLSRLLHMSLLQTAKSCRTSAKDDTSTISFIIHGTVRDCINGIISDSLGEIHQRRGQYSSEHHSYVWLKDFDGRPWRTDSIRALRCLHCRKMNNGNDILLFPRHLRVLELHQSSMQKLPESICQLRHLGYLKLSSWSGLVTLPESIGDLQNLLHIDLSACYKLKDLTGSFGKLINLLYISLSGCSALENLPESFGKLIKLVKINLSGCSALEELPEFFGKLIKLVYINLSGCTTLANLPGSIGKLRELEHVNLSDCPKLVNLPRSFGKLKNLVQINLSGCNGLEKLPDSFGKLTGLDYIDLSGCSGLEELPPSVGKLTSLVVLDLSGCYGLSKLPESFGKLIGLVFINLSGCSGLATLPRSFGDLQNLLYVDLSRCYGLSKLPESFGKLTNLLRLDLSFWSSFDVIRTALDGLTNLQHLNLSNPCCYHAESPDLQGLKQVLGQLTGLKHLNLSMFLNLIICNQSEKEDLKYIEFISGFSRLNYLNLSHSIFLCELPAYLKGLPSLHTMDLSGCMRLKKVPQWMTRMSSLKTVILSNMESYKFEVGTNNVINNYVQLLDVRCKKLEITRLNEMKSVEEAQRVRLAEKHNLQTLNLFWSVGFEGTVQDNVLLEELEPPHSLQYLELHGYRSQCLPSWLTLSSSISSFNLVEVTMENIPNCIHLPPLGLLTNLQSVFLKRMASIRRIDAGELSGGHKAAFSRLSKFTLDDMCSLEEFTYYSSGGGEKLLFPVIDKLVVQKCPNLSFVPLPPRARRLEISDCNDVMVCWRNRVARPDVEVPYCTSSAVTEVTELVVERCRVYSSHWCLLNHLPGLRTLAIKKCNNLVCSPEIVGALSSLKTLCFSECNRMKILPNHLGGLRSLQELQIVSCRQFQRLPDNMAHLPSLQSMNFSDCGSMTSLPSWLGNLTSLQKLTITRCTSIDSLPPSIGKLTNLKDLHIMDCPRLKEWYKRKENKKLVSRIQPKIEETPTLQFSGHYSD